MADSKADLEAALSVLDEYRTAKQDEHETFNDYQEIALLCGDIKATGLY